MRAEALEALLLGEQNKAVAQAQHGEGRTIGETEVDAELLGYGDLSFFADLGGGQVLDGGVGRGHGREILPQSGGEWLVASAGRSEEKADPSTPIARIAIRLGMTGVVGVMARRR